MAKVIGTEDVIYRIEPTSKKRQLGGTFGTLLEGSRIFAVGFDLERYLYEKYN